MVVHVLIVRVSLSVMGLSVQPGVVSSSAARCSRRAQHGSRCACMTSLLQSLVFLCVCMCRALCAVLNCLLARTGLTRDVRCLSPPRPDAKSSGGLHSGKVTPLFESRRSSLKQVASAETLSHPFGSPAIAWRRPWALRPAVAGGLPLSRMEGGRPASGDPLPHQPVIADWPVRRQT